MPRKKRSRQAKQRKPLQQNKPNSVRLIAGKWRGRKLGFAADIEGLRPTPDRIRETLFNWLQGEVYQAHCLDLFAGSGALGFEALSRGAAHVTFVDKHPRVVVQLVENNRLLQVNNESANVVQGDAFTVLSTLQKSSIRSYDIIFLDPPFHQGLLLESLVFINKHHLLASSGWLYIEYAANEAIDDVLAWLDASDNGFVLYKQKKAGQVVSGLYQYDPQDERV